ncbi:MAG: 5,6-dimethylbenzimidazole synthase [Janthinobacterium lividum]
MTGSFDPDFRAELDRLLAWRRDVRHFLSDPLPPGLIDTLLDRAACAPSVGNAQPWRFVRVVTPALRLAVIAAADAANTEAAEMYDDNAQRAAYRVLKLHGLREAPEHIAVFCDEGTADGHGLGRQTMPETLRYSVVLAIHTLWLSARAHGVGLGWVSIVDPAAVVRLLDVPAEWHLVAYLCLGTPVEAAMTPELDRNGWQARLDPAATRFVR